MKESRGRRGPKFPSDDAFKPDIDPKFEDYLRSMFPDTSNKFKREVINNLNDENPKIVEMSQFALTTINTLRKLDRDRENVVRKYNELYDDYFKPGNYEKKKQIKRQMRKLLVRNAKLGDPVNKPKFREEYTFWWNEN